jgi:hypothetical protein
MLTLFSYPDLYGVRHDVNTVEQGDDVNSAQARARASRIQSPAVRVVSDVEARPGFREIVVWTALLRSFELGSASW